MSSFTLKCGQLHLARNSRYVEVHSATLSFLWLVVGGIIVLVNLVVVIGQHGYTLRENPQVDVAFWYVLVVLVPPSVTPGAHNHCRRK